MDSHHADQTAQWQGWDACRLLRAETHKENLPKNGSLKIIVLENAVDERALQAAFEEEDTFPAALLKLAWCMVVGAYAGTEDVCTAVYMKNSEKLLRCRLDPKRSAANILSSLEEASLSNSDPDTVKGDVQQPTELFDSALSIIRTEPSATCGTIARRKRELLEARVDATKRTISIFYPTDIVSEQWARRVGLLFAKCIEKLAARTDDRLCDLDILPTADFEQIQLWNDKVFGNYDTCIHQVIHQTALKHPDRPAVCSWDGDFTYRELDSISSRVASKLHEQGVETGANVAFFFSKSKWAVVSMLAILKSGAAAVALSKDYPHARMQAILEFTGAAVLLVGFDLERKLDVEDKNFVKLVVDEKNFPSVPKGPDTEHSTLFTSTSVRSTDAAHIQFTSGSTGQPKGIVIEHASYLAVRCHEVFGITKESRVLQFASYTFDAILDEVYSSLVAGACICIPSEENRFNDLASCITDMKVTWVGITPTLARIIKPKDVPSVKTLCTWGETATTDIITEWADAVDLRNIYGPSETSGSTTVYSWSNGIRDPTNLGRAIPETIAWIVRTDNRALLAPIGAIGELVLQGPTVARGYLNDEARTAASFVNTLPWLHASTQKQRAYYTGDLVRYRDNGELQFCGRRDTQVKIRGNRIELGEIEYRINRSDASGETVSVVEVICPRYRPTHEHLVAFISDTSRNISATSPLKPIDEITKARHVEIVKALSKYLPEHFIPSAFLPVSCIPAVASGKADRKLLRAMAEALSESQLQSYLLTAAPKSEESSNVKSRDRNAMVDLWAEILGLTAHDVTPESNFFWLGGNSILAMKLAIAARRRGLEVTVAQILNNPGLDQLVSVISQKHQTQPQAAKKPDYKPLSSLSSVFATDFLERVAAPMLGVPASQIEDLALATDYQIENLAWSSLQTRGGTNYHTFDFASAVDSEQLQKAIRALVSYHAILRTVYFVYRRRVYQASLKQLPFEIVHCFGVDNPAIATTSLMQTESKQSLDITKALIKFWLLYGSENRVKRLVFRASHLQYDGVTIGRWWKELGLLFNDSSLAPTPSYFDYISFAANHDAPAAKAFWRKLLSGSSMTNVFQHHGIPYEHVLDGEVTRTIETKFLQPHAEITIGTAIKTAWSLVLAEMAGSRDVVFGSVIGGRNAPFPDVEHVAGACIDNIPVRVRLETDMTRLELLKAVQTQYFQAIRFENFRLKRIVEECTEWRPWERLGTLVEYENLGEDEEFFHIGGGNTYAANEIRPPADRHDTTIFSMPLGEKETFIALDFSKSMLSKATAQRILDRMVGHATLFHEDVNAQVSLAEAGELGLPKIPIDVPLESSHKEDAASNNETGDLELQHDEIRSLVQTAWVAELGCAHSALENAWAKNVPFYDVWGNLIAAYALVKHFQRHGLPVSMEDVLQHADMKSQVHLLLRLKKRPQE
ncbi:Amino acid adenylation [Akanthomyces lecanii RCEF 1005]|uniref:Amino acid adenylation n=1 Tax=Akanthomyces lecanii RCEF 1005 TaxID=1081108 RepID=A0A168DNL3_CORDF|nr:Amino acid adenylation [Akanthomyces lecanii RCEF 1005]